MRYQLRLLLLAVAAVVLIVISAFFTDWFVIHVADLHDAQVDLRGIRVCAPECSVLELSTLNGTFPGLATLAFWSAMPLFVVIATQAGAKLISGYAYPVLAKVGTGLGAVTFFTSFGAGYLVGPEDASFVGFHLYTVERAWGPICMVLGAVAGMLAVRYAVLDSTNEDAGEYKPVIIPKLGDSKDGTTRVPVTPISTNKMPTPAAGSGPAARKRPPSHAPADAASARTKTSQSPPDTSPARTKPPSKPPVDSSEARTKAPSPADSSAARTNASSQAPADSSAARTKAASQAPADSSAARTKAPSQAPAPAGAVPLEPARTKTPSQAPLAVDMAARLVGAPLAAEPMAAPPSESAVPTELPARAKAPSQAPLAVDMAARLVGAPLAADPTAATPGEPGAPIGLPARAKAPSQAPLAADMAARLVGAPLAADPTAATPSEPGAPIGLPARAKAPSQAPLAVDMAARLVGAPLAAEPGAAPSEPGARAKAPSQAPLAVDVVDVAARLGGASSAPSAPAHTPVPVPVPADQIPVAPESGLVIRKRSPSTAPIESELPLPPDVGMTIRTKTPSATPPMMASVASALGVAPRVTVPSDPSLPTPEPASKEPRRTDTKSGSMPKIGVPPHQRANPVVTVPPAAPRTSAQIAVPGRINYAVKTAAFAPEGITATREDGLSKLIPWSEIVGIVARRLPTPPPFDGLTFVDIVSTAGATMRILPKTEITGHTVTGDHTERARSLVNLLAAQALDAKLDSATKVFANGTSKAAQLRDEQTLATHDARLA